ncbi:MAG: hypothetical protein FJ215_06540 [Ignavibacteria bacterium]|nr:hypothetical protein [Ignavibacteria bacterium]
MNRTALRTIVLVIFLALLLGGCDTTVDPATAGSISMTSYHSRDSGGLGKIAAVQEIGVVDSIQILRARFLLRDIKFKTQGEADSCNFRTSPFVLDLNLSGVVQEIGVQNAPFGTYRRVEFDIHRLDTAAYNALPSSERPQFLDFMTGDRYSMIIDGIVYRKGETPRNFTFRSRVNAKQKIDLDPVLVVDAGSPVANATLSINSASWFRTSSGTLVDPTDPKEENIISDNLRTAIRIYRDHNRDGKKDG